MPFARRTRSARKARKSGPEVVALERQLDGGPQVVELVADVVAALVERVAVDGLVGSSRRPMASVSWISPPCPRLDLVEGVEDLGREDVAAHDRQVRRGLVGLRLLDDVADADEAGSDRLGGDAAVGGDLLARELLQGDHRAAVALVHGEHVLEHGGVLVHDVVAQHHDERLVADVLAGDRHGVAEAERPRPGARSGCRPSRRWRASPSADRACPGPRGRTRARRCGRSGPRCARLPRPVMMRMSRMPARTASSTTYWMAGLSTSGSISLGWALVAGRNRVPRPAAGMTALRPTRAGAGRAAGR